MPTIIQLLVLLHIIAAITIVGFWFAHFKNPTVTPWQFYGAGLALLTGLALVALHEISKDRHVNHFKIAVKLLIALGVFIAAYVGMRKEKKSQPVSTGLAHGVGGGALINIIIAVMWV